jgi:hypothetical protein
MLFKLANAVLSASNIYILQGSLVHPQNNANISLPHCHNFLSKDWLYIKNKSTFITIDFLFRQAFCPFLFQLIAPFSL